MTAAHRDQVQALLVDVLLQDTQIEVREAAAQALQSFVASNFPLLIPTRQALEARAAELADSGEEDSGRVVLHPHPHVLALAKKLQGQVTAAKKSNAASSVALGQRHGALLGLTALVLTHPYDLPSHLPSLLSFLAAFVEDRAQIVSASLRKFFAAFTSTHKEEWDTFAKQFSEEQLEELQSMQLAPSYFA